MSAKFLGSTGLTQLVTLIKNILTLKADSANGSGGVAKRAAAIPFGQVDSTSTSTAFTATIPGITELHSGVCVFLMNGVVTSASGFTVNINNLGAKPVYSTLSAASRSTTLFNVAYTLLLVYNEERVSGGCWDAYYGYDSNTNTIGYQLRTNATTMPTLDKFYRYRLLFTAADRKHLVPANTSSSTSADTAKTTTQRPIDPFGAIYYYGHTTAISANANPTASYFWTQYSFALGYSFNRTGAALTLTNHAPVYIKCAPQADGSAIIDADNPFVQTLPSTADGKIYIFLGVASSATAVELVPEHPVYYYDGGIKLWLGREVYTKPSTGIPASDLDSDVQTSLGKADTALQSHQDISGKADKANVYTKTEIDNKGYQTATQVQTAISGKANSADLATVATSGSYNDLSDKPTIPSAVTEQTVAGWGFTKNTGTYSKPSGGIPKTDLASSVQTSLSKADTALQQHQSLSAYRTASEQDAIDSEQNTAIADKQNSPYIFKVFYENGTYKVTTAPTTFNEFFSIYQDRELELEISDIDITIAKYYRGEVYPLQNGFGVLFKDMQPNIDMQTYTITGAHSAGFGLAGFPQNNTITWQALDLGNLNLANASDIPTSLSELTADSTHRLVTDTEKTTWNGKQNAISDLATIRSGAAAGATAVQPSAISDMATQTWVGQQGYQTATQVENAIPIKSVQVNGTALTPDANKAVNIQLAQIAYTLEDNGETLYISNIIELPSSENTSF